VSIRGEGESARGAFGLLDDEVGGRLRRRWRWRWGGGEVVVVVVVVVGVMHG